MRAVECLEQLASSSPRGASSTSVTPVGLGCHDVRRAAGRREHLRPGYRDIRTGKRKRGEDRKEISPYLNLPAQKPVQMDVRCRTTQENAHLERLRADYKEAFEEWALQVSRLQAITSPPSGRFVIKGAEARVAAAEVAYRDSRDRLTDDMVGDFVKSETRGERCLPKLKLTL
jgi:hypothetical protein